VVEKRPVVKEEIHIRKDVVEDTEVVEEEVRREEVEVEEQTEDHAIGTDHTKGD
jgi:stress response protein YsnF